MHFISAVSTTETSIILRLESGHQIKYKVTDTNFDFTPQEPNHPRFLKLPSSLVAQPFDQLKCLKSVVKGQGVLCTYTIECANGLAYRLVMSDAKQEIKITVTPPEDLGTITVATLVDHDVYDGDQSLRFQTSNQHIIVINFRSKSGNFGGFRDNNLDLTPVMGKRFTKVVKKESGPGRFDHPFLLVCEDISVLIPYFVTDTAPYVTMKVDGIMC